MEAGQGALLSEFEITLDHFELLVDHAPFPVQRLPAAEALFALGLMC